MNATLNNPPFKTLHPGYSVNQAAAVLLDRPSHNGTKRIQNTSALTKGRTKGDLYTELVIAEDALKEANNAGSMQVNITKQIECALSYINKIPGVKSSDPTYKPKKRP